MLASHRSSRMNFLNETRWRPTIGDPGFMGWFTVFAYALGAILALRAWLKSNDRIWLAVALGMAALCVNKQLDLQSLFTDIGRIASYHEGWYERRREFQKWFVLAAIAGAGVFSILFVWRFNAFCVGHKLLTAGVLFLLTFIVVRAISFHHVDSFLKVKLLGVKMNWALELGGIFLVILAAVRNPTGQTATG